MNKLFLILGGFVAAAVLVVGGIALGDVLSNDSDAAATPGGQAADNDPDTDAGDDGSGSQIAAATQIPRDPSAAPTAVPVVDETTPPTWPAPSPFQPVVPAAADTPTGRLDADDLAAIYDPETGIDSGATGEPWVPPTSPAFDPATGEVDPEAPAERTDGIEDVPADEADSFFIPYLGLDLPFRFVDACAGEGEGGADGSTDEAGDADCPEGIGGTIQLTGAGDPPAPLQIMKQMYTRIGVPLELRCAPLGFDRGGVHRAIFASNNPGDFTIRYWLSTEPDDVHTIEWSTPESERERWVERRLAGEPTNADMHTGVHNCPEIPGLFPGRHVTFEIHGVDDAGSEVDAKIYFTTGTEVADNVAVGRPHASFTSLDLMSGRGLVTVPYNERSEQVYVAALPRAGSGATTESCTDVENAVLAGTRRLDLSLYNWETTAFPRSDGDGYEPGIESSVVTNFAGEEGTTYDLCVWVTKPPTRSFDKPPVVMREVFTVRTPRRWRTRILLGGGHSDVDLDARAIRISPTNWPSTFSPRWPDEPTRAGAFMLDEMVVLRESGSSVVPSTTLLEVTGPSGAAIEVALPTPTNCMFPIPCTSGGRRQYDVPIPGPRTSSRLCGSGSGGCDPPTSEDTIGNLRLVVENYAGPGGAPTGDLFGDDSWQVDHAASFPSARADALPATPRIDRSNVVFEPFGGTGGIAGGRPGVHFRAGFDRPVRVTAIPRVAIGTRCPVSPPAQTTETLSPFVDMRFEGLCWGQTYGIDVIATDASGNVLDARTEVDGVPTGRGAWTIVDMPRLDVVEYSVRVTVDQLGEGHGSTYLRVGGWEIQPHGSGVACTATGEPREITIRNAGGRPITFADPLTWDLEVRQAGDGRNCGDRSHGEWMRLQASVGVEELAAGPVTLRYTDEDGTDVTVEVYDVVWAE